MSVCLSVCVCALSSVRHFPPYTRKVLMTMCGGLLDLLAALGYVSQGVNPVNMRQQADR